MTPPRQEDIFSSPHVKHSGVVERGKIVTRRNVIVAAPRQHGWLTLVVPAGQEGQQVGRVDSEKNRGRQIICGKSPPEIQASGRTGIALKAASASKLHES
jgi:hypothetical protein